MSDVKYNNSYKYIWNTQYSELKSLADENLSIDNCGKSVFILNCLLNKYLGLNENDTFSLEYYNNVNCDSILACTLFDSYIDMYNKDHIEVVNDVKEMFDRLEMYEMDTSGFYLDTGLVRVRIRKKEEKVKVKMLCVKQEYLNKILREVKDEDIKKAISLWDIYICLRNKLIENFGAKIFLEGLGIFPSYLCIRKRIIIGYAKRIKDILKYYGLEYFLFSDYVNLSSFNVPIYFSDTLYAIPSNVQSYIFHNLEKVCFCLRVRENKKTIIEWIESKLNLKRIQNHKDYCRTYYVFETDDVDVLYTMVKMLCN